MSISEVGTLLVQVQKWKAPADEYVCARSTGNLVSRKQSCRGRDIAKV